MNPAKWLAEERWNDRPAPPPRPGDRARKLAREAEVAEDIKPQRAEVFESVNDDNKTSASQGFSSSTRRGLDEPRELSLKPQPAELNTQPAKIKPQPAKQNYLNNNLKGTIENRARDARVAHESPPENKLSDEQTVEISAVWKLYCTGRITEEEAARRDAELRSQYGRSRPP
jgi:hypothetical protein